MAELQGEGTIHKSKRTRKGILSLLTQYKAALSKTNYLSDMFQSKRRRGGTDSTQKHAGNAPTTCSDAFMSVPIEVFTEIVSNLLPVDLISLSRCNKSFRNLLMNRTSRHIWASAMKNVEGLPPCPPDISEPYYSALLFLPCCTICGGSEDCEPYFKLRLRLCMSCRSKHLMTVRWHHRGEDQLGFSQELDELVHSEELHTHSGCLVMSLGFVLVKKEGDDIRLKFEELQKSGDEVALKAWKEGRMAVVEERSREAYAIDCFLIHRGHSQWLNHPQGTTRLQSGDRSYRPRRLRLYHERPPL